jgi:large subunit ribosomal protein L17
LAESLILYEKVTTTKAKAKALRPIVEKLITKAKKAKVSDVKEIRKFLYTPNAFKKMIEVVGPRYKERAGGYTRIVLLDNRKGDNSERAIIELV